jgi:hypothetical protein
MKKVYFCICLTPTGNVSGGNGSGKLDTLDQAKAWASEQLGGKPNLGSIIIAESIGVCERSASPVKFTPIKPDFAALAGERIEGSADGTEAALVDGPAPGSYTNGAGHHPV